MKSKILCVLVILLSFASFTLAAGPNESINKSQKEKAVQNFLEGLKTNNTGLQSSSAFYLGEINSSEAVIPLMRILKSNPEEELRIQAALALLKIGDARGIYAIKRAIQFDESKRVRDICTKFFNASQSKELTSPLM